MSSTLTINGTAYNQSARRTANYLIDGWGWSLDSSSYFLTFHEHTSGPQPKITGPCPVSLTYGATALFTGSMIAVEPGISATGRTWRYQCAGLEYSAGWIPVTANDGSGLIRFNCDPTNQMYYVSSMAGQSVGQILTYVLSLHASALTAAGITTDGTTASQLAALTLVPPSEVDISGDRLWPALQGFLARWARNIRLMVNATGLVRLVDVTAGTAETLTMGSDPIDPPLFRRNWSTSATRVVARGQGDIGAAYVSTAASTLTAAWNSTEQTNWNYSDFTNPTGPSTDTGTVNSVTSATTVSIKSANTSRTWASNYWSGIQAWIYLTNSSGSGVTWTECRPVTSCGSLAAGGNCTITMGYALQNSTSSAYNGYQLIGTNVPLASGGLYDVWRLYNVTDPGGFVAAHLVTMFPVPQPFYGIQGDSVALTSTPTCQIVGASTSFPAPFQILPATGQVIFLRPTVEQTNTVANLTTGGSAVTAPPNIYMMLAYSRGALETEYPANVGGVPQYSGTAYTAAGLQRTQFVDQPDWRYGGNAPQAQALAQMLQVSLCNTLVEGVVNYKGLATAFFDPTSGPGFLLSIAGNGYTTGDESLNAPVRSFSVQYLTEGGGLNYQCSIGVSTRQDPRTGESYYEHFSPYGGGRLGFQAVQEMGSFGGRPPTYDGPAAMQLPDITAPQASPVATAQGVMGWVGNAVQAAANWLGIGAGPRPAPKPSTAYERRKARRLARAAAAQAKEAQREARRRKQDAAQANMWRAPEAKPGQLMYGGRAAGGEARPVPLDAEGAGGMGPQPKDTLEAEGAGGMGVPVLTTAPGEDRPGAMTGADYLEGG